jgi:hypothetical protein
MVSLLLPDWGYYLSGSAGIPRRSLHFFPGGSALMARGAVGWWVGVPVGVNIAAD